MTVTVKFQRGLSRIERTARLRSLSMRILELAMYTENINNTEIGVMFTDDNEIKRLNNTFRNVNQPTDVLAFPLLDQNDNIDPCPNNLGDIAISLTTARKQAEQLGHSLEREVSILLIHAFAHLVGYTDTDPTSKKNMQLLEDKILAIVEKELSKRGRRRL